MVQVEQAATYQSLMTRQESLMKESKLFVFDLAKETNFSCLDPYSLLLYLTGSLPAVPGTLNNAGNLGWLSYRPPNMERDDHLVIVKSNEQYPEEHLKVMIETIASDLNEDEFIKIGFLMKKRILTIKKKSKTKGQFYKRIKSIDLESPFSKESKIEILNLWFSDAICGAFCITRTLELIDYPNFLTSDALMNATSAKIKAVFGTQNFWNFQMNYLILIDQNYFLIGGEESEDMDFPLDIKYNYIGLRESGQKLQNVKEKPIFTFGKQYLNGYEKIDENEWHAVAVKHVNGRVRLKLEYGDNVFYGVQQELIKVINNSRFNTWCTGTDDVKWEIWFGRDEQDKLSDYRTLKQRNRELQKQIQQLKAALSSAQPNDPQ